MLFATSSRGATGRLGFVRNRESPAGGANRRGEALLFSSMDYASQPGVSRARGHRLRFLPSRTSLGVQLAHARSRGILQRVSARPAAHPRRQVEVVHPPNFIGRSRRQLERAEVFTSDWGEYSPPG